MDQDEVICPRCGSRPKHHEHINGFGGHSMTVCVKCGQQFDVKQEGE